MAWRLCIAVAVVACAVMLAARAQAQDRQSQSEPQPPQAQSQQDRPHEPDTVGTVATVFQPAVLARPGQKPAIIRKGGDIRKGDELRTGAGGSLSIVFDDETTFTLTAEATITINEFVYRADHSGNGAAFNVTRGTISFIAAQVAKSGDMRITTPTATLGIRGTTGIVEVPLSGPTQVKLYQDAGGTVGRIEMFGRDGARVGELTRAATGFTLQIAGQRLVAAPLTISPAQLQRDRVLVQRTVTNQNVGRQFNEQRRHDPGRRGQDSDRQQRREGRDNNRDGRQQGERGRDRREQGQQDRRPQDQRQQDRRGRDQDRRDRPREGRDQDRRAPGVGERQRRESAPADRTQRDDGRGRPNQRDGGPRTQQPVPPQRLPRDADPRLQRQPQPAQSPRPPLQQAPRQQIQPPPVQQRPGVRPVPQQDQPRQQQQRQKRKPPEQNQLPPR